MAPVMLSTPRQVAAANVFQLFISSSPPNTRRLKMADQRLFFGPGRFPCPAAYQANALPKIQLVGRKRLLNYSLNFLRKELPLERIFYPRRSAEKYICHTWFRLL